MIKLRKRTTMHVLQINDTKSGKSQNVKKKIYCTLVSFEVIIIVIWFGMIIYININRCFLLFFFLKKKKSFWNVLLLFNLVFFHHFLYIFRFSYITIRIKNSWVLVRVKGGGFRSSEMPTESSSEGSS